MCIGPTGNLCIISCTFISEIAILWLLIPDKSREILRQSSVWVLVLQIFIVSHFVYGYMAK